MISSFSFCILNNIIPKMSHILSPSIFEVFVASLGKALSGEFLNGIVLLTYNGNTTEQKKATMSKSK